MFDRRVGFFQGKSARGEWKSTPAEYDPRVWGHDSDYTETDGWNFAFHAPQDGHGLANLYGGRDELAAKLDAFFSTPETAKYPGSYGGTIHEMIEARDVRMGQWGSPTRSRTTSRTCTTSPASRPRPRRRCARRSAGCTSAARSARATPATRTTARCRRGTSSARSASTRCRWAARTTRSARRCSRKATVHLENGKRPRRQRAEQQRRATSTSRACGQRAALRQGVPHARRHRERRHARLRHGPAAVVVGRRRGRGAAVDHDGDDVAAAAARRARRRQRRRRPRAAATRRRAVRRQLGHRGRRWPARSRGSSSTSTAPRSTGAASTR